MMTLYDLGYAISVPFGENTRYDLIIDDGRELRRVQCKTGRLRSGTVRFKTCSSYAHHRNPAATQRSYLGEIDFFAVHCPDNGRVYLIPIADVPLRFQGALRIDPPRNNQRRGIRFAADYEIGRVEIPRLHAIANSEPRATAGAGGSSA